ncbi:MAG TPA: glycosyltransferase [Azospirillum sp.]
MTEVLESALGRIIYLAGNSQDRPIGGIKAMVQHVLLLREAGFEAYISGAVSRSAPWLTEQAPLLPIGAGGVVLYPTDSIVVGETNGQAMRDLRSFRCGKHVYCQNQHYVTWGLKGPERWSDFGFDRVFAASAGIAGFLSRVLGVDAQVVPPVIDHALFTASAKRVQVAAIPRKRKGEAANIRAVLGWKHPRWAAVPWVNIDNRSEREVAAILGESSVLLALGRFEGLGLPPLEAMAAGCVVAGFTGIGGAEYATAQNGFWSPEDDIEKCADQLAAALDVVAAGGPTHAAVVAAGRATARAYDRPAVAKVVIDYWAEHAA